MESTKALLALGLLALVTTVVAEGAQAPPNSVPIVRTERLGAGVIRIVYDLSSVTGTSTVALEVSTDGGRTFGLRARATTGDVGADVAPGPNKTIDWDATKDIDELQLERFVFRVLAATERTANVTPGVDQTAETTIQSTPVASATPAAGTTAAKTANDGTRGGGLPRGAIIGIVGGGAAAAALGVALGKGGNSSLPSGPQTPQDVPLRNYTGTYTLQLFHTNASAVDGSGACTYVLAMTGSLIMAVQVTGGSANGTASLSGTRTLTTTTCSANGVPTPNAPGTTFNDVFNGVPITGTASSLSFTRQTTNTPTNIDGFPAPTTETYSFTGSLNAEGTISGSLTLDRQTATGGGPTLRTGHGTAISPVTLR